MDLLQELSSLKVDYKAASDLLEQTALEVDGFKAELAKLALAAQEAGQALSAKEAAISTLLAEVEAYKGQIEALKAAHKTAEEKAVAIVATQGIAPMAVKPEAAPELTKAQALAEYAALSEPMARANYYKTHKALLLAR